MANWIGVITNAGNSLLNEWVNEKALNFDSAAAGQGIVAEAAMLAQTTLVGQKQTASLLGGERVSAGIRLKLRITAPDTAYTLNQYGVWASVEGGTPAMIALFQHPQGVPIPSKAESPDFVYTFYGLIMCSNTGTWTVTVDTSAVVTAEDLEEAVAGKADQLALAEHEADGVKHLTAAERTAWNAKADGDHTHTAAQVGAVPTTRKVNGKALSADITLTAGDVGAFGMLGSSTTADLDTCKTPGCLLVHNSCANWPAGETADWGLLRIEANGSGGVVQTLTVRLTSTTKPTKAYYRMYSGDVWSVWGQIATDSDLEGYLPLTGGTLTGNLDIAKTIASVVLRTGDSSGRLMKNANVEGTVDDGLYLTDYGVDGSEATLKIQGGQQRLRIKLGGTDYAVYHEGSKPTPADIGAAVKYRYTATIPTGTWTAVSGGGYYKDITVSGITAAMTPCVGVVQTSDVAASELMVEEFGNNIRRIETMAGKIRVYTKTDGAIPSVNIPIQLVGTV